MDEVMEKVAAWLLATYGTAGCMGVSYKNIPEEARQVLGINGANVNVAEQLKVVIDRLYEYAFPNGLRMIERNDYQSGEGGFWIHKDAPIALEAYNKPKETPKCDTCHQPMKRVEVWHCPQCDK